MNDLVLMGVLVTISITITSLLWIAYNSQLVWELKLQHQEELERMNHEIVQVRGKLAGREIRDRVMGSTPVGRLLEQTDEAIRAREETP